MVYKSTFLFQNCKFKLQPPSGRSLPIHNPFLPPAAITQILLIANPTKIPLHLTCMLSFTQNDETVTEIGKIDQLPSIN